MCIPYVYVYVYVYVYIYIYIHYHYHCHYYYYHYQLFTIIITIIYIYVCVCAYMYVQLYAMYSKQQRDTVSMAGDMSCATKSLWPGFQKLKPCKCNIKAAYQTFGRRLFLLLEQGNKLLKQISQPVTFDPGCLSIKPRGSFVSHSAIVTTGGYPRLSIPSLWPKFARQRLKKNHWHVGNFFESMFVQEPLQIYLSYSL